jgi:uncharacterized protein (DUF952 family)
MELHHVLTIAAWEAAQSAGVYAPPELARDGFLHCCTAEQLGFVLARHFAGADGIVVMTFETSAVAAELRWVRSEPDHPPFPHLYGSIPVDAIRGVAPPQQF